MQHTHTHYTPHCKTRLPQRVLRVEVLLNLLALSRCDGDVVRHDLRHLRVRELRRGLQKGGRNACMHDE